MGWGDPERVLDYLFTPMPQGELTHPWVSVTGLIELNFFFTIALPLLWIYVNIPELSGVASLYAMLAVWAETACLAERSMPEAVPYAYLGAGTEDLLEQFLTAAGITTLTAVLAGASIISSFIPPFILTEQCTTALRLYLWLYALPFTEEGVFAQWVSATAMERLGVIPGSIISGIVFAFFHWQIYGWMTNVLLALFLFRFISNIVMVLFKSVIPSVAAHVMINFLSIQSLL